MGLGSSRPETPPPTPPPKFVPSWRDMPWGTKEQLKREILQFSTKRKSIRMVNIALFGVIGSGKSSFCNTLDSTFRGRIAGRSETGSSTHSVTKHFRKYRPGGKNGPLCYLCDTMGMEEDQGLDIVDVPYILNGNIPDKFEFLLGRRISSDSRGFRRNPKPSDQMHCVVYVLDARKVNMSSRDTVQKIKNIKAAASEKGIRFMILLTMIDNLCAEVKRNTKNAYKSYALDKLVKRISEISGLPISYIYVVKNYSSEQDLDDAIDVLALRALQQMLAFAADVIQDLPEESKCVMV